MLDFLRLTQAQLAAVHGVDVRTLRRWDADGHPRNADGSYAAPASVEWRIQRELAAGLDLDEQRARLAAAQADKVEMENAITRGEVAYLPDLAEEQGRVFEMIRGKLLALPTKCAPLANPENPNAARDVIEREVLELMTEIANSTITSEEEPPS